MKSRREQMKGAAVRMKHLSWYNEYGLIWFTSALRLYFPYVSHKQTSKESRLLYTFEASKAFELGLPKAFSEIISAFYYMKNVLK